MLELRGLRGRRGGGVGEERVLDVGGDEFLVLLLVLEAEDDAAGGFVFEGCWRRAAMAASTWVR